MLSEPAWHPMLPVCTFVGLLFMLSSSMTGGTTAATKPSTSSRSTLQVARSDSEYSMLAPVKHNCPVICPVIFNTLYLRAFTQALGSDQAIMKLHQLLNHEPRVLIQCIQQKRAAPARLALSQPHTHTCKEYNSGRGNKSLGICSSNIIKTHDQLYVNCCLHNG